jgi:hypothetical protein
MTGESYAGRAGDTAAGTCRVWQQDDGRWRWEWTPADDSVRLVSHVAYGDADEAAASARVAYPTSPVHVPGRGSTRPSREGLRIATTTVTIAAALVALRRLGRRAGRAVSHRDRA